MARSINPHGYAMHQPVDTCDLLENYLKYTYSAEDAITSLLRQNQNKIAKSYVGIAVSLCKQAYEYWDGDINLSLDDLLSSRSDFADEIEDPFSTVEFEEEELDD